MKTAALLLLAAPVLSAAPRLHVSQTPLAPGTTIELVLDKEAAPGDRVGHVAATPWLEIKPAWPGRTVWKDASILAFEPSAPPKLGTNYTFSLVGKHVHLDGTPIPAGKLITVATPDFQIEWAGQLERYTDDWSPRTSPWFVRFNGPVGTDAAPFTFVSADGQRVAAKVERATFGTIKHPGYVTPTFQEAWSRALGVKIDDPALVPELELPHGLIVTPSEALPVGKAWTLTVAAGIPGPDGSKFPGSSHTLGNIDPLRTTDIEARTIADKPRHIVVDFNLRLPKDIPAEAITLTPSVGNLKLHTDGTELHIQGDFHEHEHWTLTLPETFASADGRVLAKAVNKKLEFKHLPPSIGLASKDEAQLSAGSRVYRIATVNTPELRIRAKQLDGPDLIRAIQGYRHYTGSGPNGESIRPNQLIPFELMIGKNIADLEVDLDNPIDTSRELNLHWDKLLAGEATPYTIGKVPAPEADAAPKAGRPAAIFVEITGTPAEESSLPDGSGLRSPRVQALIQLTDLGLAWKTVDDQSLVFVYSCLTGQPLPGVRLETFAEDASALGSFTTDASGLATLPRSAETRHLRASLGDDQFVMAYDNSMPGVGLWRFPIRYSWEEVPLVSREVMMFTDRPLYRPGETAHVKGIVRRQNGNDIELGGETTALFTVTNPTGREILKRDVTISANGDFDLDIEFPAEVTGHYSATLTWPGELEKAEDLENWMERSTAVQNARFELGLRVEEFRRNAFEITHTATLAKPGDATVTLDVDATLYHGQPLANAKSTLWTRIQNSNFYPERYRDFLFGDHRQPDNGYWFHYFGYRWEEDHGGFESNSESRDFTLDADGKARLSSTLPETDFPMLREVVMETGVTDENRQTLMKSTSIEVHPSSTWIGVRRLDQLVRVGESHPLEVIAVGTDGLPLDAAIPLEVTITREVNEQVRIAGEDGGSSVRNEAREETLSTATLDLTGGKPGTLDFKPALPGLHTITLRGKDADGHAFATATSIHVYGSDEFPWSYADHMRIKLVPEKKIYQPGETARVLVLSPIEGTALVTVEREKVTRTFITTLKADQPVIEIPVSDEDAPNCYISVLVIKGADSSLRAHKEPQLRLGYTELTVQNVRDRLDLTLETRPTEPDPAAAVPVSYLPGEEIEISGQVKLAGGQPAAATTVTVWAEDEGTLAVLGFETPDPMSRFYQPRFLRVNCGTSLDTFLPEAPDEQTFYNKGFFIGGGDGAFADAIDMPRRDFNPCAFWQPAVTTDADGRFKITAKLPDTLTRYRLMAVAHHGAARFGHAESEFTVNQPLIVEPQVPRFAMEGDQLDLQTTVRNTSDIGGTWEITLITNPPGSDPILTLSDDASQTTASTKLTLAAGQSSTVRFPVTFRNTGEAIITWKATPVSLDGQNLTPVIARRYSDAVEHPFPVDYPVPLLRQTRLVKVDSKTHDLDLLTGLDPALLKGRGTLTVESSRSLLLEAASAVRYLLDYPYGCAEQTTSALIPWLAADSLRGLSPDFARHTPEETRKVILDAVGRLLSMQRSDGGFGYWPGADASNRWSSSYVGLGILLASKQVEVPASAIDSLTQYLLTELQKEEQPAEVGPEIVARELYILALAGKAQPAMVNEFLDHAAELDSRTLCFIALAQAEAGDMDAARATLALKPGKDAPSWMPWEPTHAFRLLAWSRIDPDAPESTAALDRLLRDRNPYGHWRTTWSNAWAILAIAQVARHETTTGTTSVQLTGSPIDASTFAVSPENPTASREIALVRDLKVKAKSDGTAYVRVALESKPEIAPIQPVAANGMEITRSYRRVNADGSTTPLDVPKPGDLVRIDLEVILANDDLRYLVVEDRLPAIFEAINDSFESQAGPANAGGSSQGDWSVSHTEIRGDRAMFFFDRIWTRGRHTLTYLARCTMTGTSMAPPAKVESMYDPDNTALSASRTFQSKE